MGSPGFEPGITSALERVVCTHPEARMLTKLHHDPARQEEAPHTSVYIL